ncbi:oxidoreductase [Cnuibacter physcomitrellae]|nr:SDR family oxidoreductase [Cnuibacter physcomitrellae]GGI38048.1 oxidoreductase [Cnuibacter physcomitrellae]
MNGVIMKIFVTGASGFIGSAVTTELLSNGHEVVGLARSEESADVIRALGASVARGSLEEPETFAAGAAGADGVAHMAFRHVFTEFPKNVALDRAVLEAMADVLEGTGKPLSIAGGTAGIAPGRLALETDDPDAEASAANGDRAANGRYVLGLAARGVRSSVVRFAPTVHDSVKRGFMGEYVDIARRTGVAGYVGDGSNRWSAVHVSDAARLVRLALEAAPAGTTLHGVGEEAVVIRDVAELVGARLGVPTASIDPADAPAHFGWLAAFIGSDIPASNALTREWMHWTPTGPTLTQDLSEGSWFDA